MGKLQKQLHTFLNNLIHYGQKAHYSLTKLIILCSSEELTSAFLSLK